MSVVIQFDSNADSRTADNPVEMTKPKLLAASTRHIGDVIGLLGIFAQHLLRAAARHDYDKLSDIDQFLANFRTKFAQTGWWDNHRKIHRHHLAHEDGIPEDVDLLDVLEYVADCVAAGAARKGYVDRVELPPELLSRALQNTVRLLMSQIVLTDESGEALNCSYDAGDAETESAEQPATQKDGWYLQATDDLTIIGGPYESEQAALAELDSRIDAIAVKLA